MRLLIISIVYLSYTPQSLGQELVFNTDNFGGQVSTAKISDSTKTYILKLTNKSVDDIYLLKTWTSFEPIQKSNPTTVYFDMTFPMSADIYSCKSCSFKLYKVRPSETVKFEVIKTNYKDVSEIVIMFDQIILSNIKDNRVRNKLLKSDSKGKPDLDFKYYYETGGGPLNGETIRLKM